MAQARTRARQFHDNRRHWDSVLDPQNLDERRNVPPAIDEELAHWDTPEQRWAVARLEPVAGCRVLELGGGLGVGAAALARRGARVVLFDISPRRAGQARKALADAGLADRVHIVVGAAEQMPFRDGAFQRVTTKSVLIHTDLPRAAGEVHRVLEPGGRAVVIEPLASHPAMRMYRRWFAPASWRTITRYWNRRCLEQFADPFGGRRAALRLRRFYLLGFLSAAFTYGRFRHRGLRRIAESLLEPIDALLLGMFPRLRRWCWFVVVEARRANSPSSVSEKDVP